MSDAKVPSGRIEVHEYAWDQDDDWPKPPATVSEPRRSGPRPRRWSVIAGLSLLVGACIVVAITEWPRKIEDSTVSARKSALAPRLPSGNSIAAPQSRQLLEAPRVMPVARPVVPAVAAADSAASEEQMESLPITVAVIRGARMIKVQVASSSPNPLTVTIKAVNQATQKSALMDLDLAPFERKIFTSNDLDMSPGDLLVLHSPQFADQTAMVF
jgi:hypothetical protein